VFSFWKLVGSCTASKGYLEGLVIKNNGVAEGVGGGMCQLTNLIHWLILHSPLTVLEHHHHNQFDLFPDFGRTVPFGTGTSIMYNYLDYQFINQTSHNFQLVIYTTDEHLCGELRSDSQVNQAYHVEERNAYFSRVEDIYYRHNEVYKVTVDKATGNKVDESLINRNRSKVLYDARFIPVSIRLS
jgi:vancomycin resistance protein VanW